jgi:hypothetical protein
VSEVTPVVDDQEMLRAYAETIKLKDAEIAQLKAANTDLQRECLKRGTTIADMQRLIIRAADALEDLRGPGWHRELITELRKAAE